MTSFETDQLEDLGWEGMIIMELISSSRRRDTSRKATVKAQVSAAIAENLDSILGGSSV
jgi:hypothetical protein